MNIYRKQTAGFVDLLSIRNRSNQRLPRGLGTMNVWQNSSSDVFARCVIVLLHVRFCILIATILQVSPAGARAEDWPAQQMEFGGETLVLNGFGSREHWWTEIYRCALYLPRRSDDLAYISNSQTTKALQISILSDNIPDTLPQEWRVLFREELSRELLGKLKVAAADLQHGDQLLFVYTAGQNTQILVNNVTLLTDPGHHLMYALLDQWLGYQPVSENLRRLLLGDRGVRF